MLKTNQEDILPESRDNYSVIQKEASAFAINAAGINTPNTSFFKVFKSVLLKFVIGILGMIFLGVILGIFPGGPVLRSTGYFSELSNLFALVFYVFPLTILFSLIAYTKKDFVFALYPIIIYFFGYILIDIYKYSLFLLRGYVPYLPPEGYNDYVGSIFASVFVLVGLYIIEKPLNRYTRLSKISDKEIKQQKLSYLLIFLLVLCFMFTQNIVSKNLYFSQQKTRAYVSIPDNEFIIGSPLTTINNEKILTSVDLIYSKITKQYDGKYQMKDEMAVTPLAKWWDDDVKSNCTKNLSLYESSPAPLSIEYKQTKNNIQYVETIFKLNSSNLAEESTSYNKFHYCFINGFQQYEISRKNVLGDGYLKEYPAEIVIDSIISGNSYLPLCFDRSKLLKKPDFKTPDYCNSDDSNRLNILTSKAKEAYNTPRPEQKTTGIINSSANPSAYPEVGRLTIKEWGISFPLTKETRTAYYVASTPSGTKGLFTIGLKSFDTKECSAVVRKNNTTGVNEGGYGVAFIGRTKVSEIDPDRKTSFVGVIKGDYVYTLFANGNLQSCLNSVQGTSDLKERLSGIFEWAEVNIR